MLQIIILLSIVLQLGAAYLALRLLQVTGHRKAWLLISISLVIMAVRRAVSLVAVSRGQSEMTGLEQVFEILGLLVAVLLIWGMRLIRQYFVETNLQAQEIHKVQDALKKRDQISQVVNRAGERFLRRDNWREGINSLLASLGEVTNVSRVYLFQINPDGANDFTATRLNEWVATGIAPQIGNGRQPGFQMRARGFSGWIDAMSIGKDVQGIVSEMVLPVREILASQQIRSMCAVPVIVRNQWWGYIGFDDCEQDRSWLPLEMQALRAAASMLSAVIERQTEMNTLADLIQSLDAIVWELDISSQRFTFVSQRAEQILGYPVSEWIDLDFWAAHIYEEDRDWAVKYCLEATNRGEDHTFDYRMVRANGGVVWLRDVVSVTSDGSQPVRLRGLMVDITARKLSEQALNKRAAQLALLNELGHEIATLDVQSVLDRTAQLVHERFGYANVGVFLRDESNSCLELQAQAGDYENMLCVGKQIKLGEGIIGLTGQSGQTQLANDTRKVDHYMRLCPEMNETRSELAVAVHLGDEVMGVVDAQSKVVDAFDANDILVMETLADQIAVAVHNARLYETLARQFDELAETEMRFRGQSEFLHTVIEALPHPFFVLDAHSYEVLMANSAALEDREPGILTCHQLSHRHDQPCQLSNGFGCPLVEVRQTRSPVLIRHEHYDATGRPRQVEVHAYPILGISGEVVQLIEYTIDITDRVQAELALRRKEQILEAVSYAAEQFLRTNDWQAQLPDVLLHLGRATQTHNVFLLENFTKPGGRLCARKRIAWHEPELGLDAKSLFADEFDYDKECDSECLNALRSGNVLSRSLEEMPDSLGQRLMSLGARALLVAPIFAGADFWGIMGFIDHKQPRSWPEQEREALLTAANLLGAAIFQQQTGRTLRHQAELVDRVSDAIISVDREMRVRSWNKAAENLYGWSADEAAGQSLSELVNTQYPDDVPGNDVLQFVAQEGVFRSEVVQFSRVGTPLIIDSSVTALVDDQGHFDGLVGVNRDITERKHLRAQLEEINARLESTLDALPDLLFELSDDGFILDYRAPSEGDLYVSPSQFLGKHYADFMPLDAVAIISPALEIARQEGHHFGATYMLQIDNQPRWFECSISRQLGIAGDPPRYTILVRDVTSRRQFEIDLERAAAFNAEMAELTRQMLMADNLELAATLTLQKALALTRSEFGFVGYIDPKTGYLVSPTLTRDVWELCGVSGKSVVFREFKGLFGWVLLNKHAILTNDPANDARSIGTPKGHVPLSNFLSAPALDGAALVGQIAVANTPNGYSDQDLLIIERLAAVYALGVRRKQAEEDLQAYNRQMEVINQAAQAAMADEDIYGRLNTLAEGLRDLMSADDCFITLWEDSQQRTIPAAASGPQEESFLDLNILPGEQTMTASVLQLGEPIVVENLGESNEISQRIVNHFESRSMLALPLQAGGIKLGAALIAYIQPHEFSRSEIEKATAVANSVSLALSKAYLLEAARRKTAELQALAQVSAAMRVARNHQEIARIVLDQVRTLLGATAIALVVSGEADGELRVEQASGIWQEYVGSVYQIGEMRTGIYEQLRSQPLRIDDAVSYANNMIEGLVVGVGCLVAVGLAADENWIGTLWVGRSQTFTDDDARLLAAIGDIAANAMQRSVLHEDLARQLETLQKTQARLVQSEKLAAVGELVAGVAHELNNPLAAVVLYAQLAESQAQNPALIADLEKIVGEAQRASKIVRGLLEFSRRRTPERKPSQINTILQSTLDLLGYELRTHNVSVDLDLARNLPLVLVDQHQLQQVFVNIINNAWQALQEQANGVPRRIVIQTLSGSSMFDLRKEQREDVVRIIFQDNGPGISPEDFAHIFNPFFTTKPPGQGTGLGLSICHGIVSEHGGHMWAESELDKGTTFFVEIPLLPIQTRDPDREVVSEPSRHIAKASVLVIDDETNLVNVIQRALRKQGYLVYSATNGVAGLRILSENQVDLILCDIRMPELSGPDLYQMLELRYPEMVSRIIFTTGDSVSPSTRRFLDTTGVTCLEKPFELADLILAVKRHLSTSSTPAVE